MIPVVKLVIFVPPRELALGDRHNFRDGWLFLVLEHNSYPFHFSSVPSLGMSLLLAEGS
jgi:hypothetical protein